MKIDEVKKIEFKFVSVFYWLCLMYMGILLFDNVDQMYERVTVDKLFTTFDFHEILYLVYFPIMGLWCLKHNHDWGYIFLGAILYYIEENFWYSFIHIID